MNDNYIFSKGTVSSSNVSKWQTLKAKCSNPCMIETPSCLLNINSALPLELQKSQPGTWLLTWRLHFSESLRSAVTRLVWPMRKQPHDAYNFSVCSSNEPVLLFPTPISAWTEKQELYDQDGTAKRSKHYPQDCGIPYLDLFVLRSL